jgi:hypothetical protein
VEDLAYLLITSERTISRILATYAKRDIFIPTRGRVRDIGPVVSHKAQAVHLYLKGLLLLRLPLACGMTLTLWSATWMTSVLTGKNGWCILGLYHTGWQVELQYLLDLATAYG